MPAPIEPSAASPGSAGDNRVALHCQCTPNLPALLEQLGISLLISTYQTGQVLAVGVHQGALSFTSHHFDQATGLAIRPDRIAVGSLRQVWVLRAVPELGPRVKPAGKHDTCFLTRSAHYTGEIYCHEMAWIGDDLLLVNTLFSCLCSLSENYHFVPRWRPPFITALAAEDRCHINGLAVDRGVPKYVTALGESDTAAGWRPTKATGGCLIDVPSGATVARGFAMAHSPRVYNGRVWVLDSGRDRLTTVDPATGHIEPVAVVPGYARGLAFFGPFAFVGLSRIRASSVLGAEGGEERQCGVDVIDLRSGRSVARLLLQSGVDEIFDVQVLPGMRCPFLSGPNPAADGSDPVWWVPVLGTSPKTSGS